MSSGEGPRIEYVEARRVLLDALDALRSHLPGSTGFSASMPPSPTVEMGLLVRTLPGR